MKASMKMKMKRRLWALLRNGSNKTKKAFLHVLFELFEWSPFHRYEMRTGIQKRKNMGHDILCITLLFIILHVRFNLCQRILYEVRTKCSDIFSILNLKIFHDLL